MLEVELNRQDLDDWRAGISKRFRRELEIAQGNIRREWTSELLRQLETRGDGQWVPLSRGYAKKKNSQFAKQQVAYGAADLLRRTGRMIDGYIQGIAFDTTNTRVSAILNYPENTAEDSTITARAVGHQENPPSDSHPLRPFDVDKFEVIAENEFNDAMGRAAG